MESRCLIKKDTMAKEGEGSDFTHHEFFPSRPINSD